jgi:hypothetical protein
MVPRLNQLQLMRQVLIQLLLVMVLAAQKQVTRLLSR